MTQEEAQKKAEAFESKLKETQTAIEKAATKEELEAVTKSVEDMTEKFKGLVKAEDIDGINKSLKEQGEAITAIRKKGSASEGKDFWGEFQKNLEDNKETLKDMKSSNSKSELEFTLKVPALMTTTNAGAGIAFNPAFLTEVVPGVQSTPKQQPYLLNYVNRRATNARTIYWIDRVTGEGDAAFIAEGALKPLVDVDYVPKSAEVKKVAERWKYSEEMMEDTQFILADAREHFEELIRLKIDDKIFAGDSGSTAAEVDGITTFAGAFVAPSALADSVADANLDDAVVAAATQIRLGNFMPTHVFLNPADVAAMQLTKASDGHYLIPPFATANGLQIDGLTVVSTNRIPAGKFLLEIQANTQ